MHNFPSSPEDNTTELLRTKKGVERLSLGISSMHRTDAV